jgi:hypothetical protein
MSPPDDRYIVSKPAATLAIARDDGHR